LSEQERLIAGRYRLGALVGRGGMAEVYEGVDTRLGRTVAIKLLKADLANDPNFESRFRQEAQASARMAHPTIVRVYDAGEEESVDENGQTRRVPFIVMEFVRGKLLRELIAGGNVTIEQAVNYVAGILTALEVSHRAGVVHRDMKPANVMIVEGDGVKVMDFGIARAVSDNSATQAATNGIMGTAQYFSPEQARGDTVDARTDLYSTGVILYELLAGRPPFRGESAVSVAYQHVSEAVTATTEHNPNVSPEIDAVVMRAMAKDREERFQTAEEFREHLLAAAASSSESSLATRPVRPVSDLNQTELLTPTSTLSGPANGDSLPTELLSGFKTEPNRVVKTSSDRVSAGLLWGLGAGVIVIVVGLLIWMMNLGNTPVPTTTSSGITVADVVGSLYEDANSTLSQQDLLVLRVFEQNNDVAEGVVIRQEPEAGTMVLPNTTVKLFVSSGAATVRIPNLSGTAEFDAITTLQGLGLNIGLITEVNSATVPAGVVISTDPAVNASVAQGSEVSLVLSNGKVMVPDVRNLAVLQARQLLTAPTVGFAVSIEIIDAPLCTGTPGTVVIEQSIAPGEADQLQSIILYVECIGGTPTPTPTPTPTETNGNLNDDEAED
jgi:serine/threonine protein kinase